MEINDKLQKEITETAYLNQENTFRYRPIMRFFYQKHEQAENWLYKEDVYEALAPNIPNYTLDDCQRDLDFLVSKMSLSPVQDTENANTLDKFKYKNFRYQMTDYAIEIERTTIRLEELVVKVASLEPRLFERIKAYLKKILNIADMSESEIYEMWGDLTGDFDPEGLIIANNLKRRFPNLQLFCYDTTDYYNTLSDNILSNRRLKKLRRIENIDLQRVADLLIKEKRCGYQENNIDSIKNYIAKFLGK